MFTTFFIISLSLLILVRASEHTEQSKAKQQKSVYQHPPSSINSTKSFQTWFSKSKNALFVARGTRYTGRVDDDDAVETSDDDDDEDVAGVEVDVEEEVMEDEVAIATDALLLLSVLDVAAVVVVAVDDAAATALLSSTLAVVVVAAFSFSSFSCVFFSVLSSFV